jgi:hypothetical protein
MVWLCNSASWKFVSARLQQYVLQEDSDNDDDGSGSGGNTSGKKAMQRQKNAGLKNLTNNKAFELACFCLFGGQNAEAMTMTVCQDHQISKLQSTSTRCQTLVLRRLPRLAALPDANDNDDNRDDTSAAAAAIVDNDKDDDDIS